MMPRPGREASFPGIGKSRLNIGATTSRRQSLLAAFGSLLHSNLIRE
jgi:hypothetical protein